ncbi:protein IQ-DOMAIN 1-like [Dorcoceras hygrometricum]|uniref:Protein IQ-DOMAIN 1-like n=1 Tax=Dorcoceras hygrometricum TaxID=472368 RepID=A0A2Z7BT67_9LAMI|nr:protein IQ-DOMAIN 1-like [Dorcoceras hygrometricum]
MQMPCMRSRLQTNTGSQRIPRTAQQLKSEHKAVSTMCVSIWELPTRLNTWYHVHYQRSICCCPTHEMWELPTPLTVANSPSKEMRDGITRVPLQEPWHAQISKQDTATIDLITAWNRCVYAVQQNATDNKTIYTASQNSKHEHISMPNINTDPSNADLTPAKPITNNYGRTLTNYKREMSSHTSPASSKCPKAISKRNVSARGVQRYHSHFNRSCLPSAIEEDKVR